MSLNLSAIEEVLAIALLGLVVIWVWGVVKLFQKNHRTLGWVALAGLILPPLMLVGYARWFASTKKA
jgi:hypothetical protein